MNQLKRIQKLPVDLTSAWQFFADPAKLKDITPPSMGFQITSVPEKVMYEGMIITYKISPLLNVPVNWMTEITHISKPYYFVDEQRHGPYKIWHHRHLFSEIEGGVEMTDIVDYVLPFGILGKLSGHLFVRKKLDKIFDYRYRKLEEIFGTYPEA